MSIYINNIANDFGAVTYTVTASSGEATASTISQYSYQIVQPEGDAPYTVEFDMNSGSIMISAEGVESDDLVTFYIDAVQTTDAGGSHAIVSSPSSSD